MRRRCLLVDDSTSFLRSARRVLTARGFDVLGCARSGAEAAEIVAALAPDVVLVDLELGDEDGAEVARAITSGTHPPLVVLISAYDQDDPSRVVAGTGAIGFLPKTALAGGALEALLG